jgi:uncharacterized protein YecE (DUF72 family)
VGAPGRLYVGTSGFDYPEWIGPFYPPGTKSGRMLAYYAGRFGSVEVNFTFRRLPAPSTVSRWVAQTPDGFTFSCKAHRGITHHARLVEAEDRVGRFLESVAPLGDRLGPILFQCPPNLGYDPEVLDAFLRSLPATRAAGRPYRYAMEFRHPSFDTEEVRERLAAAGVAWCVVDREEAAAAFIRTARDFAYVRLRRDTYGAEAIAGWARVIGKVLEEGVDVYAYLKHEDSAAGPRDAAALQARAAPNETTYQS